MAGPWERFQPQQAAPWRRFQKAPAEKPNVAVDMAASGASGIARGGMDLLGLPGTIGDALNSAGQWTLRKGYELATGDAPSPNGGAVERFFAGPQPEIEAQMIGGGRNPLSGANIRSAASSLTDGATEYEPKTTAGKYTASAAEFLPGAAAFGGMSPGNLLRYGVLPGLASEGAGQLTEGSAIEPYARIAAALAAPMIPGIVSRVVSPMRVPPERADAANILRAEGVEPTAGQVTGNRALRYAESELGGSRAAQMMDDQAEAFTSAAMQRAGATGRATADNMAAVDQRLGHEFNAISARNTLQADPQLGHDIGQTLNRYGQLLETQQRPIIEGLADDIINRLTTNGGRMAGAEYQVIRSDLTRAAHGASNENLANALRGLRDALDDAMERSIIPSDVGAWGELRRQYGNMKVLERASTGGGENAALGLISPAQLRMAAVSGNRGGYARGEGDFSELARAGQAILTPLPNSGTAGRISAQNLGTGLTSILGAGAGSTVGGIPGAMAGAAAGAAIPRIAGALMMSRAGQGYLTNQMLSGVDVLDPRYAGLVAALLGRQQIGGLPAQR